MEKENQWIKKRRKKWTVKEKEQQENKKKGKKGKHEGKENQIKEQE